MAKTKATVKKVTNEPVATLSVEELNARLAEARESQFRLKFRHATHPLKNPMELRGKRREIATLMTWLTKKQKEVA